MSGLDFLPQDHRRLFIGGAWTDADGGGTFDVLDPADGSVLCPVADGTVADGERALEAAVAAQDDWARTNPRDRGEILRRTFELVAARTAEFAELMSLEMGKTLKEAAGEVAYGNEFLRWFSEEAVRIHGRWMQAPAGGSRLLTIKKPAGRGWSWSPGTSPGRWATGRTGRPVAAGGRTVARPARQRPWPSLALAGTSAEAGRPEGFLTTVTPTAPARSARRSWPTRG